MKKSQVIAISLAMIVHTLNSEEKCDLAASYDVQEQNNLQRNHLVELEEKHLQTVLQCRDFCLRDKLCEWIFYSVNDAKIICHLLASSLPTNQDKNFQGSVSDRTHGTFERVIGIKSEEVRIIL